MQIREIEIRNFRSISHLKIRNIDEALILIGKNGVGKTQVLRALSAVFGRYDIRQSDFFPSGANIEVTLAIHYDRKDYEKLWKNGRVSRFRDREKWEEALRLKLPSLKKDTLRFTFVRNSGGEERYADGFSKHNGFIKEALPRLYLLDDSRSLGLLHEELLSFTEDTRLKEMRSGCCLFDSHKPCTHCFSCIGLINQKKPEELSAFEAEKLLEYKLYALNLEGLAEMVTERYHENGGEAGEIHYALNINPRDFFKVESYVTGVRDTLRPEPVSYMGRGMKSLYLLSLLEVYLESKSHYPGLLLMENPEMFLHPELQKTSSEILYRLSKHTQVMFITHSPHLLFPFRDSEIRQIQLDASGHPEILEKTQVSEILSDLGFSAADLLGVGFVFIVEGKEDKCRLPLLLRAFYRELRGKDDTGREMAIITTNSCTNIQTYANLKFLGQLYLKKNFLLIRDSDGQDRGQLRRALCDYYRERNRHDIDGLPKVAEKNVLVLKYYSFENYFLNPSVMKKVGVIPSEAYFYETLYEKWQAYLYRIRSGRHLREVMGKDFSCPEDMKNHMEEIKIYLRGHNLFDIFYGPFKDREKDVLEAYIQMAPREDFEDIFDAIERFAFFDNRKREKE